MRGERSVFRIAAGLWLGLGAAAPALAWTDGPPVPAELGEIYISATGTYQNFKSPKFDAIVQYVDDSAVTASGQVSTNDPVGHLLSFKTADEAFVPELAIGYGARQTAWDGLFGGLVRPELSVKGFSRSRKGSQTSAAPPLTGFVVFDPVTGAAVPTGLIASYHAIDGTQDNPDGTQAGLLTTRPISNISFDFDEKYLSTDLMVYFDEEWKGWQFSRGAGLSYAYAHTRWELDFNMPSLIDPITSGDIAASIGGDDSFDYDYDIQSHYIGMKMAFSVGRILFRGLSPATTTISVFANGSFEPLWAHGDLDGRQEGPCLTTCNFQTFPRDYSRGTVHYRKKKDTFAYNARIGGGASIRLWMFRVTGQAGYEYFHGFFRPQDVSANKAVKLDEEAVHGYFFSASATLTIPTIF